MSTGEDTDKSPGPVDLIFIPTTVQVTQWTLAEETALLRLVAG